MLFGNFQNKNEEANKKLLASISKIIQIVYFNRVVFPEEDKVTKQIIENFFNTLNLHSIPLSEISIDRTKLRGNIPTDALKEYLKWLATLPPYQVYRKGAFGLKFKGPVKNRYGIIIPRLSDIFLTLTSIILTPRVMPKQMKDYKLFNSAARNYVKYLENKKSKMYFGPAINDLVDVYYQNYFAIFNVLSKLAANRIDSRKEELNELVNAKVIELENLKKLETNIYYWLDIGLLG